MTKMRTGFLLAAFLMIAACDTGPKDDKALAPFMVGEMAKLTVPEVPVSLEGHIIMNEAGEPLDLSQTKGKALLVNLWAPWCAPCRAEMKELAHLQAELGSDTFEVVAVNVNRGGIEEARETLKEWNIQGLPLYAEPTMGIAFDLAEGKLPTSFVVDTKGKVRALYVGPLGWDKPEAFALFTALKDGSL